MKTSSRMPTAFLSKTIVLASLATPAWAQLPQPNVFVGPGGVSEIADLFDGVAPDAVPGTVIWVQPGTYQPFDMGTVDGVTIQPFDPGATGLPIIVSASGSSSGTAIRIAGGQTRSTVIRGLTLEGGTGSQVLVPATATSNAYTSFVGGGLLLEFTAPTIEDCVIRGNSAEVGAGAWIIGPAAGGEKPLFSHCLFEGNDADSDGGGLSAIRGGVEILDSHFVDNTAFGYGGGIVLGDNRSAFDRGDVKAYFSVIRRCEIRDNGSLAPVTQAQSVKGGGLSLHRYPAAIVESCEIFDNRGAYGGGVFVDFAGVDMDRCSVRGNYAQTEGGGVYITHGINNRISSTVIDDNEARGPLGGGGVYAEMDGFFFAPMTLRNCLVVNNRAPFGIGGGVTTSDASGRIVGSTIARNSAGASAGVAPDPVTGSTLRIESSIVTQNTPMAANGTGQIDTPVLSPGAISVTHSVWTGGQSNAEFGSTNQDCSVNFLTGTPSTDVQSSPDFYLTQSGCGVDDGNPAASLAGVGTTDAGSGAPDSGVLDAGFHYEADAAPAPPKSTITASYEEISITSFDNVTFTLDSRYDMDVQLAAPPLDPASVDAVQAFNAVLGSVSGTSPGIPMTNPSSVLPLALDGYTNFILNTNGGLFVDPMTLSSTTYLQPTLGLAQIAMDVSAIPANVLASGSRPFWHAFAGVQLNFGQGLLLSQNPSNAAMTVVTQ